VISKWKFLFRFLKPTYEKNQTQEYAKRKIHSDLVQRDGDLINHWYVLCTAKELNSDKNKPIGRVLYDRAYVIFRNQLGKVTVLPDRCLHRNSLLSMEGRIKNGCLVCPYHGWEYNQNGQVVHIPSEGPETQVTRNLQLELIPTIEQDGLIWIYPGTSEKMKDKIPPFRLPRFGETEWNHYVMITDFNNEATNLAENFMDVPHTVYVHKGWFRDKKSQQVPMTVETKNGSVLVTYHQKEDQFSFMARILLNPNGKPMRHTDQFIFPNMTKVEYYFGDKNGFIINSHISPISKLKSRVYTYIAYRVPFIGKVVKPYVQYYTRQVIEQDVDIMINQGTSLALDQQTLFRSTPADEVHMQIERLRYFGQMGEREKIDIHQNIKDIHFWI